MNTEKLQKFLTKAWAFEHEKGPVITALEEYITISNDSPNFDADWAKNGYMDKALALFIEDMEKLKTLWAAEGCKTDDISWEIISGQDNPEYNEAGARRTPLLLVEVPAFGNVSADKTGQTALLYGHIDKQPALEGQWSEGLAPRIPVIREGKLYGRGGADDGYAFFSAFSSLMALRAQGTPHARAVILIEACEESGSEDLEHYIKNLAPRLGDITLIVCLDSGCESYDQLWVTASLRGMVSGVLKVDVASEGVHSGDASGIEPSSFRIMRHLISRLEDENTGAVEAKELNVDIPDYIIRQAKETAQAIGDEVYKKYPLLDGVRPVTEDLAQLVLNRSWRPQLSVIGIDGLPPSKGAGNVMLPSTHAALSFRLPPGIDSGKAALFIKKTLEKDPPHQAKVTFEITGNGDGWAAPEQAAWLDRALKESSQQYYGQEPLFMGEGGSISFMAMLGEVFPRAQFLVTGVLGPRSNAHGPDEFLHIDMARNITLCVAHILAAHAK